MSMKRGEIQFVGSVASTVANVATAVGVWALVIMAIIALVWGSSIHSEVQDIKQLLKTLNSHVSCLCPSLSSVSSTRTQPTAGYAATVAQKPATARAA